MKALLLKDARAAALPAAAVVAFFAVTSPTGSRLDEVFFWLSVMLMVGLWFVPPLIDWQVDADRFLCSLPVDRTTIVRARGVWTVLAAATAMLLWIASGMAWRSVRWPDAGAPATPMWTTFEGLVAFALVAVLLGAIFLPCYSGLGLGKGAAVFGIASVALLGGGAALAGAANGPGPAGGSMPAAAFQQVVGRLRDGVGAIGSVALLFVLAALVSWVSLRVSARWYERREF